VSHLTATAVPPHLFAAYHWLLPVGVPHTSNWHYGWARQTPHAGSLSVDPATLDPALRPLVTALHQRGIRTLPSCQGHFFPRSQTGKADPALVRRYRDLQAQAPLIRGNGLLMRDVESGKVWRVQDSAYKLPTFYEMMRNHYALEGIGYLGILMSPNRIRFRDSAYIYAQAAPGRLDIWVESPDARHQRKIWDNITKDILDQT
jgi:hypothetical protein